MQFGSARKTRELQATRSGRVRTMQTHTCQAPSSPSPLPYLCFSFLASRFSLLAPYFSIQPRPAKLTFTSPMALQSKLNPRTAAIAQRWIWGDIKARFPLHWICPFVEEFLPLLKCCSPIIMMLIMIIMIINSARLVGVPIIIRCGDI